MVDKSLDASFNSDWNKAIAFATAHGIKKSDIVPIYQQDAQNVANGSFPMSMAERNRALLAAKNPNNVTPVTSDNPSPKSLLGNARTNLQNIFTGLAPNHLIPNIAHQVETAIAHPSTWIKPLGEVAGGAISGNAKEVKAGLEQAAGANSILNWIPGVYDLGTLAKGGVDALATQPITAFLDVAPFAPAGRVASIAADDARLATMASKLGMTVEQFKNASIPKMGMGWAMMRPLTKYSEGEGSQIINAFPGAGKITRGMMTDSAGNPLTFSGMFQFWAQKTGGLTQAAAGISAAQMQGDIVGTDAEMYSVIPTARAELALSDDQVKQVTELVASGKDRFDVMGDDSIEPEVRDAYSKSDDLRHLITAQGLASNGTAAIRGPTGVVELYSNVDRTPQIAKDADTLRQETYKTLQLAGPMNQQFKELQANLGQLSAFTKTLEDQRQAALAAPMEKPFTDPVYSDISGAKPKGPISLNRQNQNQLLLGDDGVVGQIAKQLSGYAKSDGTWHNPDPEQALALTRAGLRNMEKEGYGQIERSASPAHDQLYQSMTQMEKALAAHVAKEKDWREEFLGQRKDKGVTHTPKMAKQLKRLYKADKAFKNTWWDTPSDAWRSVQYDAMIDEAVRQVNRTNTIGEMSQVLKDRNYSDAQAKEILSDPRKMAEAIYNQSRLSASNPAGPPILEESEINAIYQAGVDQVKTLREMGHEIGYVPVVSTRELAYDPGRYGVRTIAKVRDLSTARKKNMGPDFQPERYDLLAALHLGTKEVIQHNNAIHFVEDQVVRHAKMAGQVYEWASKAFPDEYAKRDPGAVNETDLTETLLRRLGLTSWDPKTVGVDLPRFSGEKIYIPTGLAKALNSLTSHGGFPMDGAYDRATNVFRTSILGLSPRFTAHIVFGGAFLVALRADPSIVTHLREGWQLAKDPTKLDPAMRQVSAERGVEPAEYRTVKMQQAAQRGDVNPGLEEINHRGGATAAYLVAQENLAKKGLDWRTAGPVAWLKSIADVNFRFTRNVSTMYRAAAMLDFADKAEKRGFFEDPETGERIAMTPERAKEEGIQAALKMMGDLQKMTPLERQSFMRIMPFYGWTRHILNYVLTYPVDHPYRASFLAVQASLDSDSVAKALDTRWLFMLNIGSPSPSGAVKGVDVRFLDPLRDVANYASLSGWIGALNPVITAPLAAIDPNLVFGNTSLYPNVTYNQLYGIETSAPQGNPATAVAQTFVSQIGALDSAIQLAGNYRSLATKNPNAFYKTIFESLNIPFAQVQNLNVKQLAAKGELARYRVASQAANNAWTSPGMGGAGIEKSLAGYASVPDPLNPDYEVTPAQLQNLYNALLQAYPGQNPSDAAIAPPTPPPTYTP